MRKKKEELTIPCAYQGGKQRIAKDIVNIIFEQEEITEDTKFYDLCCGSGAITIELINRGVKPENITMVDKSPWGKFWELIGKGEFDLELFKQKIDIIPKDIGAIKGYMDVLAKEEVLDDNIGYDFLLLQAAAFGSKPIHISGNKWKNTNFRNHWMPTETSNRKSPVNPMMPMPDTLYSRVGTIYKKMLGVKGVYDDIDNVSIIKEAIIYIDPPYENTAGYYYEFDYMNFISEYKNEFNIYVSEGKNLEEAVALPINSNRKKGGVNVKRKKAHSEWLNIYKKNEEVN